MTTFEEFCNETAKVIEDFSDSEKEFMLWLLLDYYREKLLRDIQFEAKDKQDVMVQTVMKKHIDACDEMRRIICTEIF